MKLNHCKLFHFMAKTAVQRRLGDRCVGFTGSAIGVVVMKRRCDMGLNPFHSNWARFVLAFGLLALQPWATLVSVAAPQTSKGAISRPAIKLTKPATRSAVGTPLSIPPQNAKPPIPTRSTPPSGTPPQPGAPSTTSAKPVSTEIQKVIDTL